VESSDQQPCVHVNLVHKNLEYSDSPKSCLWARSNTTEERRIFLMRQNPKHAKYMAEYDACLAKIEAQLKEP